MALANFGMCWSCRATTITMGDVAAAIAAALSAMRVASDQTTDRVQVARRPRWPGSAGRSGSATTSAR
jgi:hypothetical protein